MRPSFDLDFAKQPFPPSSPHTPLSSFPPAPPSRPNLPTSRLDVKNSLRYPAGVQQQKEGIIDREADLGRGLLLLVESLSDGVPLDLLVDHEGKSLEVGARLPPRLGRDLLGPGGSLPLGGNLSGIELLLNRRGTGGSGKRLEDEGGEGELLVRNGLSGNRGGGSVDESLRCKREVSLQYIAAWQSRCVC